MTRRIALLLGCFLSFAVLAAAQTSQEKLGVKEIQWLPQDRDLMIVSDGGEKYVSHLHPLLASMEKEIEGGKVRLLLHFPYRYEAILQLRLLELFTYKVIYSANRYDKSLFKAKGKEAPQVRLEGFALDIPEQKLSVGLTPGAMKDGSFVPAGEKLEYVFDMKSDKISRMGKSPHKLEADDANFIGKFLGLIIVYCRESVEWYETEMAKQGRNTSPPIKL